MSLPECTVDTNNIQNLPDSPTLPADELKQEFDKSGKEIKNYINETLIPAVEQLVREEKANIEKSIQTEKANLERAIDDKILEDNEEKYPIGKIIISSEDTNPNTYLGFGIWTKIEDKFLLASGETYTAKETGGEAEHKLTLSETPIHNHVGITKYNGLTISNTLASAGNNFQSLVATGQGNAQISTAPAGGDQPHNNMPPYYVVHIWERIA